MGGAIGKIISEQNQRLLQQIAEGKNPVVGKGGMSIALPPGFRSVSAPRSPSGPIISRPVQQNITAEQMYREATGEGIPRRFQGPIGSSPLPIGDKLVPIAAAQGGVVQAGIGGLLKALSPAALAVDTLGIADVDKFKAKDMLGMLSPAAFFAKDPKRLKYMSPAYMASQKPSALSPAATVMMNRGMAQGGGISSLAYGGDPAPIGFANQAFEGMVPGQGSGMSDSVPFSIEGQQPALLSRDEYVLPADVVSQLGDGSSGAGADMLDNFVSRLRQSKYGNSQQPPANGGQMMNNLMRQGGVV